MIYHSFQNKFLRWGWDGVYEDLLKQGYTRSLSGMVYAAKRMGLGSKIKRKAPRKNDRRFPECLLPGEKVQIDVKEVPFNCLKKSAKINENAFINIPLSMSVPEYALYIVLKNILQRTLLDF